MSFMIETSARHIHLTQETVEKLFGKGYELTVRKPLSYPGQYACNERLTIVGPKKEMANVSILGPVRKADQVEVSATDARTLGITAPVRESGHVEGSGACKLVGPKGEVELSQGVIIAKRHLHVRQEDAEKMGVKDKEIIKVACGGEGRKLIFDDVVVRVNVDGANYYLSKINKPLGFAWSIAMIYGLITAAGVHTGSVVTACESLGIPRLVATIVVCIIIALIIFGGIQALVQITERLVPFMAAIYIIAGLAVVVLNIGNLIPAIVSIFKGAFTGTAAIGGFAGATISAAIRNGCARGVYSSDAGNGQSSIAYSQSSETDPVKQGMWGIFEVFFDTIVVCTFTALVILCTGVWQTGEAGSTLAITAFTSALGGVGKVIASIGLMMFAGSTVLAFCTFIGLTCENVFGKTGRWIGQIGFVILAFVGGMVGVDILLGWADFGNSLTLTLNIIGLLCFSKKIAQWTRNYFEKGNSFAE